MFSAVIRVDMDLHIAIAIFHRAEPEIAIDPCLQECFDPRFLKCRKIQSATNAHTVRSSRFEQGCLPFLSFKFERTFSQVEKIDFRNCVLEHRESQLPHLISIYPQINVDGKKSNTLR